MSKNSTSANPAGDLPSTALTALEATDLVFSALAHPARRRILLYLQVLGGQLPAGQIAERFACSWPTITRHLRVLETAGLVTVAREGRVRLYILDRARFAIARDWLAWFDPPR